MVRLGAMLPLRWQSRKQRLSIGAVLQTSFDLLEPGRYLAAGDGRLVSHASRLKLEPVIRQLQMVGDSPVADFRRADLTAGEQSLEATPAGLPCSARPVVNWLAGFDFEIQVIPSIPIRERMIGLAGARIGKYLSLLPRKVPERSRQLSSPAFPRRGRRTRSAASWASLSSVARGVPICARMVKPRARSPTWMARAATGKSGGISPAVIPS